MKGEFVIEWDGFQWSDCVGNASAWSVMQIPDSAQLFSGARLEVAVQTGDLRLFLSSVGQIRLTISSRLRKEQNLEQNLEQ